MYILYILYILYDVYSSPQIGKTYYVTDSVLYIIFLANSIHKQVAVVQSWKKQGTWVTVQKM